MHPQIEIKANYTLTILNDAPNSAGAARFVNFLLSAQGHKLLAERGVDVTKPAANGQIQTTPAFRAGRHRRRAAMTQPA